MKDYYLNYDECNDFILHYRIKKKKIITKLLNGEVKIIPYSKENENKIISKMEKQARIAKSRPFNKSDLVLAIVEPLTIPLAVMNFMNNASWYNGVMLVLTMGGAIDYSAKAILNALEKRDIKKLNYFLDHKKELNEGIKKSKEMRLNLSEKTLKEIDKQERKNRQPFNINNIDNYSLNDLKILKANIERFSSYEFENIQKSESTAPVLKKTLNYKRK